MPSPNSALASLALKKARTIARSLEEDSVKSDLVELRRAIVLKPALSPQEPGVILISFESQLAKLSFRQIRELLRAYRS